MLSSLSIAILSMSLAAGSVGVSWQNTVPMLHSLLTLIGLSLGAGMLARVFKLDRFMGITFVILINGYFISTNSLSNLTGSSWLNYFLFVVIYFIVACRLPSWLPTWISVREANSRSLQEPARSLEFLRASRFYSNEAIMLPLPDATKILRRAAIYDWPNTRQELAGLIAKSPQYAVIAREVLVEHLVNDLKERKNLLDIAGVHERLHNLLPDEKILKNETFQWVIRACCDIGDTAQLYCADFGRENDLLKLRKIDFTTLEALRKLETDKSKPARQLKELLELWGIVVNREINKVTQQGWQVI